MWACGTLACTVHTCGAAQNQSVADVQFDLQGDQCNRSAGHKPSCCFRVLPLVLLLRLGWRRGDAAAAQRTRRRRSSLAAGSVADTLARTHREDAATPEEAARKSKRVVPIARALRVTGIRVAAVLCSAGDPVVL
jgi:hypothetical protein